MKVNFYTIKATCFVILAVLLTKQPVQAQISTFAGRNTYLGDGALAVNAGLYGPYAIARDTTGNIYVATTKDNRVRRIDAVTHVITTIAGTGIAGYSGDNGPATAAELHFNAGGLPGIAVDKNGNIYIGDYFNNRVRKINTSGVITTIAGVGVEGYSGDGSAAVAAELDGPAGIAIDAAGDVLFADNNNSIIREINASTSKISTVAGSYLNQGEYTGDGAAATSAGLNYPERIALDASGNLYISDEQNFVIREVNASTQIITTIAGNGTDGNTGDNGAATSAELSYTIGITVDASGDVFIADQTNNRIREVNGSTKIITTVAGNGTKAYSGDGGAATSASLSAPSDVMLDKSNNLYIVDNGNLVVRMVNTTGTISTAFGDGTDGFDGVLVPTKAQLLPQAVAIDPSGNIYVADGAYYDVRAVTTTSASYAYAGIPNPDPAFASDGYAGNGSYATAAKLNMAVGVAVDASNNVYIADVNNNVIRVVNYNSKYISNFAGTSTAGYSGDGAAATSATLKAPYGVAVDSKNNVYIADAGNNRIRKVTASTGYISTIAGNGTAGYTGDGAAATAAEISGATGVAVDATGNVFILDKGNARVRMISASTGYISTILNNSHSITGIAVDSKGNIYVSDSTASNVLELAAGTYAVTTVAGSGAAGYSGDGGAATSAKLNAPGGLLVDGSGNIYVADVKNNVVRKIIPGAATPAIANNVISTTDSTVTCDGKISLTTITGAVPTGGTGTYTYQWKQSSDSVHFTAITGATSQSYAVNATITAATFYRRFVTSGTLIDSGNALGYHPRTTPLPTISLGHGATTFCTGTKDTLTASSGFIKYAWSNSATTQAIIDSVSGTFYVTVTDSFGCVGKSASTVVTARALPAPAISLGSGSTTFCSGGKDTLTATAGYAKYAWSNAATTASIVDSVSGTFYVSVTDSFGCVGKSASVVITVNALPTPAISLGSGSTNLCKGKKDTLTATSGYTKYAWSNGATTSSIVDSIAGTFYVTATNSSGCVGKSASVVIALDTVPVPTISLGHGATTFCSGVKDTLTATAGYSKYAWSTGATASSIIDSVSGTFYVTVTNSYGCTGQSSSVVLTASAAPVPTISLGSGSTSLCKGKKDTLTATSGYTKYAWSSGAATSSIVDSVAGTFYVTVTNSAGCSGKSSSVVIALDTLPVVAISLGHGSLSICSGAKDTLTATSGYKTYAWSTGATTSSIVESTAGTYYVTVTNSYGCSGKSASDVITVNALPATPTITSSPATTTSLCTGTAVTLTSSTGTTYKWSTGATTSSISLSTAGSYTVTITNASGCTATSAAKVVSYVACGTPSALFTATPTGKTAALKWKSVACAVEYEIEYQKSGASTWTTITTTNNDTTYTLSGLSQSTKYLWQVASVCVKSPLTASAYTASGTFTTTSATSIEIVGSNPTAADGDSTLIESFSALVYPNPASSIANLSITGATGKVVVIVYDLSGRPVWKNSNVVSKTIAVPVSTFAQGMYFISISDEKNNKVLKLVKE